MTKTTKIVLSVAILGVGGFLLYKNFRKAGFAGNGSAAVATVSGKRVKFAGNSSMAVQSVSGKRKRNTLGGNVVQAQASNWVRGAGNVVFGAGANGAPSNFFDTSSSGWVR